MSVRGATVLVFAVLTVAGLSACHDGAGKRTETTQIRITGTPKAGHVAPASHDADKPADPATPAAGSKGQSGVGAGSTASQES
ncbi:MAG: hypothetical protein EBR82_22890 [Caulobacteraceae bacterium]|nr:hypothetical protein [Caulobacteraceae bacterium]